MSEIAEHIHIPEDLFDLYIRLLAIVKDESSDAYKQVNALTTLRASVVDVTGMLEQEIARRANVSNTTSTVGCGGQAETADVKRLKR